jgi:hypothetical protein
LPGLKGDQPSSAQGALLGKKIDFLAWAKCMVRKQEEVATGRPILHIVKWRFTPAPVDPAGAAPGGAAAAGAGGGL